MPDTLEHENALNSVDATRHGTVPDVSLRTARDAETSLGALEARVVELEQQMDRVPNANKLNLLVFDGSRDRLLAAFVIATGAAACGMEVKMFFTFWSIAALRKESSQLRRKTWVERAFGWLLPRGLNATKLSQLDMCGMGRALLAREMKKKQVADLPTLIEAAADLGVEIQVCEMSMKLMGIQREEILEYPGMTFCGVASFAESSAKSNTTLFI